MLDRLEGIARWLSPETMSLDDAGDVSDLRQGASTVETRIAIQQALGKLAPKERVVFTRRYLIGESQTEVAQAMNLSHQRISQLE